MSTKIDNRIDLSDNKVLHQKRVARLSAHKRRTLRLLHYLKSVRSPLTEKQTYRYRTCHSYLLFHHYPSLSKTKLHEALHCDMHLLCPMCAIRRAAKSVMRYENRVLQLTAVTTGLRLYYVVLTIKNDSDLLRAYLHLFSSVQILTRRRREAQSFLRTGNKRHASMINSVFANVTAGAYSVEVKRGSGSGDWHPHINLMLLTKTPIEKESIIAEWEQITTDSFIVHCEEKFAGQGLKDALVEIFKYAMKFSEMTDEDMITAWQVLRGRKLVGSFGDFRGIKDDSEEDDLSAFPYEELFYQYNCNTSVYERK